MQYYTVCLDPGHGPGCANLSPDRSYEEQEFAMDLARRMAPLLEREGVQVILTRGETGYPSLRERCNTANALPGLNLFVSLHSNAAAASGWSSAGGYMVYTSAAGESTGRNRAAKAILRRWAEMGLSIRGAGLYHFGYTVLAHTSAPALLLEHGFHTNREDVERLKDPLFRAALAKANVLGILDFLGITPQGEGESPSREDPQRSAVQARFGLQEETMDYLAAYRYGAELLRKLAEGE